MVHSGDGSAEGKMDMTSSHVEVTPGIASLQAALEQVYELAALFAPLASPSPARSRELVFVADEGCDAAI
jgi:hypothetical protein